MNAPQIINYLQRIDGVEGCCIATADGQIIEKIGNAIMDDAMFSEVVTEGFHLLETLKAGFDGCREVQLNFELKKLLIRLLGDHLLVIIVGEQVRVNDIRVAANIVANRFLASQATAVVQTPAIAPAIAPAEPKQTSFFSFGQKSQPATKPKPASDDSIWG